MVNINPNIMQNEGSLIIIIAETGKRWLRKNRTIISKTHRSGVTSKLGAWVILVLKKGNLILRNPKNSTRTISAFQTGLRICEEPIWFFPGTLNCVSDSRDQWKVQRTTGWLHGNTEKKTPYSPGFRARTCTLLKPVLFALHKNVLMGKKRAVEWIWLLSPSTDSWLRH
jgi:hypothetical protein